MSVNDVTAREEQVARSGQDDPALEKRTSPEAESALEKAESPQDSPTLPVDRGWAWVIAFSAFLNLMITVGYNRSLSVLFVDIGQAFQESNKVVSLMFTFHALSGSVISILTANVFMTKFSIRTITVASAALNALTDVFVSLAPNMVVFLWLFFVKGIAFGGLLVCPMSLVGFYFKQRRALATALANSGFCVGYIVFPPIAELLRLEFGFRGTLLIMSAVEFHLIACNMLLRPVESYKRQNAFASAEYQYHEPRTPIYNEATEQVETSELLLTNTNEAESQVKDSKSIRLTTMEVTVSDHGDEASSSVSYVHTQYSKLSQMETIKENPHETSECKGRNGFKGDNAKGNNGTVYGGDVEIAPSTPERLNAIHETRNHYTSQLSIVSSGDVPCVIATEIVEVKDTKSICQLRNFIDLTLFKSWLFRMMVVFTGLGVFTNYLSIYMPIIAFTSGISKSDSALLMTISGLMDLVTRVVTGFLGDLKFVSKTKMVAFSTFVITILCQCTRLFNTYSLFVLFAVLVGTFGGFRQNFSHAMMLDYFGAENLAKANGLTITIATLVLSINHPVLGAMLDATGSFIIPLHYVGAMTFLATLVLLLESTAKRLDDKNNIDFSQRQ
ncbi:monocarboxylate transporter 14 [Biomphalaria pfeifferi]|uniref:Monocarboxylate transporter 14 n=1 Tax=Biomphalaria pfeifferi TaxID=112525 RepID=A0AAD8C5X3_BIOPF|nr:monocarboxylate transporter 14 [Biomphalaria pfeifferi]